MKIGMITDSLPGTDFDTLVATAARLELDMLEFGCGSWSAPPHLDLDRMLETEGARRDFKARLDAHAIAVLATIGHDDVFSIEHEDPMLPALEGVEKSVAFLRNVLIKLPRAR
jgi:sugar phosphate isomerase/epimerase